MCISPRDCSYIDKLLEKALTPRDSLPSRITYLRELFIGLINTLSNGLYRSWCSSRSVAILSIASYFSNIIVSCDPESLTVLVPIVVLLIVYTSIFRVSFLYSLI